MWTFLISYFWNTCVLKFILDVFHSSLHIVYPQQKMEHVFFCSKQLNKIKKTTTMTMWNKFIILLIEYFYFYFSKSFILWILRDLFRLVRFLFRLHWYSGTKIISFIFCELAFFYWFLWMVFLMTRPTIFDQKAGHNLILAFIIPLFFLKRENEF